MTTTTKRPEVVHDERLLELLWEAQVASQEVAKYRQFVRNVAFDVAAWTEGGVSPSTPKSSSREYGPFVQGYGPGHRGRNFGNWMADTKAEIPESIAVEWAEKAATLEPAWETRSLIERAAKVLAGLTDAKAKVAAAVAAIDVHEEGYTGWSRYVLVTSSAGHEHRSMNCSTCYPSTTYAPVPSLSGTTDAEAVEELGETLCTVCFPDAPVKPSKVTQAQALTLLEKGEDAFVAARSKAAAKAARRKGAA